MYERNVLSADKSYVTYLQQNEACEIIRRLFILPIKNLPSTLKVVGRCVLARNYIEIDM